MNLFQVIKIGWWLALALVPFALLRNFTNLRASMGCPPKGDCYQPGWEAFLGFELTLLAFVIFVWPVCVWNVAGNIWQLVRRMRGQQA